MVSVVSVNNITEIASITASFDEMRRMFFFTNKQ